MAPESSKSDRMGNVIGPASGAVSELRPHVPYTDLREWIEEAKKLGEIREAPGLSWQKDIGMASEVILHDENAPCVLFTDVPGTLKGSKVLVNFFGGKRQRMTLGFPTHLSKLELSEGKATCIREVDAGLETLEVDLPAVFTADLRLNTPRYVKLPDIMKAKKKPLDTLTLGALEVEPRSRVKPVRFEPPPQRQKGVLVKDAAELVTQLKHKGVV